MEPAGEVQEQNRRLQQCPNRVGELEGMDKDQNADAGKFGEDVQSGNTHVNLSNQFEILGNEEEHTDRVLETQFAVSHIERRNVPTMIPILPHPNSIMAGGNKGSLSKGGAVRTTNKESSEILDSL